MSLENVSLSKEAITGASSKIFANALSDYLFKDNSGELDGGIIGNIFSSGVGSATNTIANNVMKGLVLTSGLGRNVGTSLASSGVGIGSNFIGQGIDSLGGHSMLSRGVGQGVATGLGTVGGLAVSNLIKYGTFAGKAANGSKAALIGKGAGSINPYGLAATVAGTALGAAFGPSKEYGGKYGSITQTMDTVYDGVTAAANFIPGWGQLASGFMTLNKGLSNIFGSTSGMTKTDAILGSAFMPAPVKWLNMANAKTTGGVDNYSWLNQEKLGGFMGDAFGDTWSKINKAVDESGKTYGTFSNSAYKDAQGNINYVNSIYNPLLAMANQNEYQGIRAFDMDTINNLRYSQWIQGGFKPITVGKKGMKIFNNATNHNIGMRLLSAAALIDNKSMILSAQGGTKVTRPPRMRAHRKGDESRGLTPEEQEWWRLHEEEQKRLLEENTARKIKEKEEAADKFNQQVNTVMGAMTLQANETPFTGQEYQQAAENLIQKKVEKFHEAEKIGEAALMADLAVSTAPLLQRGFRWAFNKAGLLVKVPINRFTTAKSVYNEGNMTPIEVLQATGKGISDVYKTYSPGGAWYQRLLANGVPKEEVDRLASEYLKNLRKTTFEITDSPLSDAVAVTGGEIRNGEMIPKITMDPRYAPNALLVRSAASHEGGHASTLNLEPKNSPYREPEHEGFYLLVEKENPEITKAMEYNESLRPNIKDSALDEVLLDETGNAERHINNVISSQEIRQRALASEIDASNKGVTMNEYISNPNLWDLNFKQLMEIFEKEGIGVRNYMLHFKSLTPTIVGGSTAATLYNSHKKGGKILKAQKGTKTLSLKSLEELVLDKQKAFEEKIVKPIMIGYDKNRAFTLTNAGSLTGAHLSEEMIEYIMSEAKKAGIDLQTALGIVGAESTFGNPTDDKSSWKISSGIREQFNNVYPGTHLHINTNGDSVNEQELVNFYYPLEDQNPYTQQLNEARRRAENGEDYNKVLSNGMNYADKLAQKPIPTGSIMQQAFEYFKKYGEKYNSNYLKKTGQSYVKHVLKKGKEALQSPEIQQAINNITLRRILPLKTNINFVQWDNI